MMRYKVLLAISLVFVTACGKKTYNDPYPSSQKSANTYYTSFNESPKTLDPALSYNVNETIFIAQIYEPPLQYHYLKRPFTLIPLTAKEVPQVVYLDVHQKPLSANAPSSSIAYSVYKITLQPGIFYQPHPAFAKKPDGNYYYHNLKKSDLIYVFSLNGFKHTGTRELTAEDYVYEIKRLADPKHLSPILDLMGEHILGLSEYAKDLKKRYVEEKIKHHYQPFFFDLRQYPLEGVKVLDRYTYSITLKGKYPQFVYWLAMPFFSSIPWEADKFYSQPGMRSSNITFNWYPVGTGPFMMKENNPNRQMVLVRNPYFHKEYYPTEGSEEDKAQGLLVDAGKQIPFVDRFVFTLEKESIPRWNKFLQGYYDQSTISSDSFDQVIQLGPKGEPYLSPEMRKKNIRLQTTTAASEFYMGFNMRDDVVGGYSERAKKLRQAIAIAVDYEEYIVIFLNGRGLPAQGPLPSGIFGYREGSAGLNPYVYNPETGKRRTIAEAKQLMKEAGYPNGLDPETGHPLILNYDVPITTTQDSASNLAWMRKQFAKIGIELQIRDTLYNRFQEKMSSGNAQIYAWGWVADYPDPENFLFLLYGPNSKALYGGENASNYNNPKFNQLFLKMKDLSDGPERQAIIDQMLEIVRQDTPWVWGYNSEDFQLSQQWMRIGKPNQLAYNTLKYIRLDPKLREIKRERWNHPIFWPIALILLIMFVILLPVFIQYWRSEHHPRKLY